MTSLRAIALNCSLKAGDEPSSTDVLLREVLAALGGHDVEVGDPIRLADLDIKPGVTSDEGGGDQWPDIRRQVLGAHILVMGTPIWMGQPSSVAKRALERLNALMSEEDDQGRMVTFGHVAAVAVVGNEDGAHHVSAELFQSLNDCGFTIPAGAVTYWVGEAMGDIDYRDLDPKPDAVTSTTATVARNTAHLARVLAKDSYPAG